jgi:hypothetical protein
MKHHDAASNGREIEDSHDAGATSDSQFVESVTCERPRVGHAKAVAKQLH